MPKVIYGRAIEKDGNDFACAEILANADGSVFHLERLQDFVFDQPAIGALPGIGPADGLAHQGVSGHRGIIDHFARRGSAVHVGADRGDDFIQAINVHARLRREDAGQARTVREEMEKGDVLPLTAGKLGNDLGDFCCEREFAALDRAEHEHVGDGLGGRE